ncbi:hypothetical protein E3I18_00910 [Candidatus Woesebacteria bacterium]|nr:MAG: hypothetical protein E3I18_00910 [Candidatus Woesebacteria bacterium]
MEVKIRKSVRNFVGDEMINPNPPRVVHDNAIQVLSVLEPLFQGFQQVFVGSITNITEISNHIEEEVISRGFYELGELGWVTINDDEFTPTQNYLESRVLKTSKWYRK